MKTLLFVSMALFSLNTLHGQNIHDELNQVASDFDLMGQSVIGICNGERSVVAHTGLANLQLNKPITDSTLYRIASISKTVTAIAMMTCYDDGLFNLEDDVSDAMGFLLRNPNFPDTPITYRMLLSHTSSLIDGISYNGFLSASYAQDPPPAIDEVLIAGGDYYSNNMWLTAEPGTYFSYSNINFGVVATLVEKLTNTRFDVYCNNRIFQPLNLNASFNIQDLPNIENLAVLYRKWNNVTWDPQADDYGGIMPEPRDLSVYPIGSNAIIFGPQGGLRISAIDLSEILLMLMHNGTRNGVEILSESTAILMRTAQWTYDGDNGNDYYGLFKKWGLGMHLITPNAGNDVVFSGLSMAGHPGEAYGLVSDFYFNTDTQNGVIFLTNGCGVGYDLGTTSAFYEVEEAVFAAVETHVLSCPTTIAETPATTLYFDSAMNFIHTTIPAPILVFDVMGKMVLQSHNHANGVDVNALPIGCYIATCNGSSLKFTVH